MIPIDPDTHIDTARVTSLGYWSARFGVTDDQLIAAVEVVGPLADRVEDYLNASSQH
jgi:hypothetical protein